MGAGGRHHGSDKEVQAAALCAPDSRDNRTILTSELLGDLGKASFLALELNLLKCKNWSPMNSKDFYKKTSAKGPAQCRSIEIMHLKCSAQCQVHREHSINAGY